MEKKQAREGKLDSYKGKSPIEGRSSITTARRQPQPALKIARRKSRGKKVTKVEQSLAESSGAAEAGDHANIDEAARKVETEV